MKTFNKIVFFIFVLFMSIHGNCETVKSFAAWLNESKDEIRFLQENTIIANTREQLVHAYNNITLKGGTYNRMIVRGYPGCDTLKGWSYARIIEIKEGSNVVKVRYKKPFTSIIDEAYVHINQAPLLKDMKSNLAK